MFLKISHLCILSTLLLDLCSSVQAQTATLPTNGWARNSVNAVIFRKNSVVSHAGIQYTAYYEGSGFVVLAKRRLGTSVWESRVTAMKGTVTDAHNAISIMVDGGGFLHLSWDHHNNALNYCKSLTAGSLDMGVKTAMIGSQETSVSYPEFHRLPGGDLIFMYRDGASGNGNLVINRYNVLQKRWSRIHTSLINGEALRNAYWQAAVDQTGVIHLSWVWRESADVASNHDLCYARSSDGGATWTKTDGAVYRIPIVAATAEYALRIPERSELINQTSICGDESGNPYICSYWKPAGSTIPQLHVVYRSGGQWRTSQVTNRRTPFTLSGVGTKKIPISRPQVVVQSNGTAKAVYVVYRDVEQGDRVTLVHTRNIALNQWTLANLTTTTTGSWEPSFDTELWKNQKLLHIYVQRVGQGDGETLENLAPQTVTILEWNPCSLSQPNAGCGPLEIDDKPEGDTQLQIYPNPFHHSFTLTGSNCESVSIFNQIGTLVSYEEIPGKDGYGIDLKPGVYTLLIHCRDKTLCKKLIKY